MNSLAEYIAHIVLSKQRGPIVTPVSPELTSLYMVEIVFKVTAKFSKNCLLSHEIVIRLAFYKKHSSHWTEVPTSKYHKCTMSHMVL